MDPRTHQELQRASESLSAIDRKLNRLIKIIKKHANTEGKLHEDLVMLECSLDEDLEEPND